MEESIKIVSHLYYVRPRRDTIGIYIYTYIIPTKLYIASDIYIHIISKYLYTIFKQYHIFMSKLYSPHRIYIYYRVGSRVKRFISFPNL